MIIWDPPASARPGAAAAPQALTGVWGVGRGCWSSFGAAVTKFCVFGGAIGAGSAKGEQPQVLQLQSLGLRQSELSLGECLGLFGEEIQI